MIDINKPVSLFGAPKNMYSNLFQPNSLEQNTGNEDDYSQFMQHPLIKMMLQEPNSPAMDALKAHLGAMPQQTKPELMTRLSAIMSGFGAGYQNPAEGSQTATNILQAPYMQDYKQWLAKGQGLEGMASIEEKQYAGKQNRLAKMMEFADPMRRLDMEGKLANIGHVNAQTAALGKRKILGIVTDANGKVWNRMDDESLVPAGISQTSEKEKSQMREDVGKRVGASNADAVGDRQKDLFNYTRGKKLEDAITLLKEKVKLNPTTGIIQDIASARKFVAQNPQYDKFFLKDKGGNITGIDTGGIGGLLGTDPEAYQQFYRALDAFKTENNPLGSNKDPLGLFGGK
jgi:hypothetical protein